MSNDQPQTENTVNDTSNLFGEQPPSTGDTDLMMLEPEVFDAAQTEVTVQNPEEIVPVKPKFVTDDRDDALKQQANNLVEALMDDPSNATISAQVYSLGEKAMTANTENVALMDQKIGPVLESVAVEKSPVDKKLTEITGQLDLVNPSVVANTKGKFAGKILWIIPWVFSRLPKGAEVMSIINEKRDTVRQTIDKLKQHLWQEQDKALRNAIELGQIADELSATQDDLREATYVGQLVWAGLNQRRTAETEPDRVQALRYLVTDLAMIVVDLQTVDQLNVQSRMGAETLINNCRQIKQLVHRVTNVLLPSVATALAVKAAANQQAGLVNASRSVMQSAGSVIKSTAQDIHQTSVAIAEASSEAMVDVETLEAAATEFEQMQAKLTAVMNTAEQNARTVSNTMSVLNSRMSDSTDPLTRARQARANLTA